MFSSETAFCSSSVEFWGAKTNSSFNSYGMVETASALKGGGGVTVIQIYPLPARRSKSWSCNMPGLRTSPQTAAASSSPWAVAWASRSVASAHPAKPSASCICCAEGAWIAACKNRALSVRTRVWSGRLSKSSRTTARKSVIGI